MLNIHDGQCGLCTHFGEPQANGNAGVIVTQIRSSKEAKEDFVDDCGHPKHASLHLKVTAISGCDGFAPVKH